MLRANYGGVYSREFLFFCCITTFVSWSDLDATEGTFYNASALPVYFVHFFPFFYFSDDLHLQLVSPPWRFTMASLHATLVISQTVVLTPVTT